ncbi:MAG: hypothetical protein AAF633_20195 [Chloroflexota bacterium]
MQVSIQESTPGNLVALAQLENETYHFRNHQFSIPIQEKANGITKYYAQMCGFQVESDRKQDMPKLVRYLLSNLINVGRLPDYVFIANRARRVYPVYTLGNEVAVTTPNGPVFRHVELAKVREYLNDYLHTTKILGEQGKSDKLHVRGINRHNLGLRAPLFYLKKYKDGEERFWAPVFENGAGDGIYVNAADSRRDIMKEGGQEVIQLTKLVGELLITQNRLSARNDLRADRLRADYWERVKGTLTPTDQTIKVGSKTLEVYQDKQDMVAVEHRTRESGETKDRYGLYLGKSFDELEKRVVTDFGRRGIG